MFRPNRFFSIISMLVIAAFLFTACAPAATPTAAPTAVVQPTVAPTQPQAIKIGLFLPSKKTMRYDTKDMPAFQAKLKEICPTCQLIYDNSNDDAAEQQSAVESAIANGVKVIAIMAVDTKAAATIADKAKAAGIPVIAYSRLLQNSDGVTVNIGFNLADIGVAQAKALVDALNKKGIANPQIAMINGGPTDSNMPVMKAGSMSVFQPLVDAGKLTIVKSVDTPDWDPTKAQNEMQQILTATGGKIDGVFVMNDGMASGVFAAINAAGITPVPPITGLDCELAAIQRILVGQQLDSVYLPIPTMAVAAAQISYALATTGKVPADMINGKVNNGSIDVPSVFINVENVDITNIKQTTLIADNFWTVDQICTTQFDAACKAAGLK